MAKPAPMMPLLIFAVALTVACFNEAPERFRPAPASDQVEKQEVQPERVADRPAKRQPQQQQPKKQSMVDRLRAEKAKKCRDRPALPECRGEGGISDDPDVRTGAAEAQREREEGYRNCAKVVTSEKGWLLDDGPLVALVREGLRDPDSLEVIQHDLVQTEGRFLVYMDYRARNAFGGYEVATAVGEILSARGCHTKLIDPGY